MTRLVTFSLGSKGCKGRLPELILEANSVCVIWPMKDLVQKRYLTAFAKKKVSSYKYSTKRFQNCAQWAIGLLKLMNIDKSYDYFHCEMFEQSLTVFSLKCIRFFCESNKISTRKVMVKYWSIFLILQIVSVIFVSASVCISLEQSWWRKIKSLATL